MTDTPRDAVSHVTLTTNAKGKVQAEVKVYHDDPEVAATKALEVLAQVRARLGADAASG